MNLLRIVAFFLLAGVTVPVVAEEGEKEKDRELGACAAVKGELMRLACYDKLAKKRGVAVESAQKAGAGSWEVQTETNPMDDSTIIVMALPATQGKSRYGKTPTLILRCKSGDLVAYIQWFDYLGSTARVTHRIGKTEPRTMTWGMSTDSQATFYPGAAKGFIDEVAATDTLVAEITPYSESPVTAVFKVEGLKKLLPDLKEHCPW